MPNPTKTPSADPTKKVADPVAPAADPTPPVDPAPAEPKVAKTPEPEVTPTDPPADPKPAVEPTPPAEPKTAEPDAAAPPAEPTADPEAPEARVVPAVADFVLPEGVPTNVAQFAFDNDMTQAQLDKTLETFAGYTQGAEVERQAVMKAEGEKLVESWGKVKTSNLSLVTRALSQNDPEGKLTEMLNESGYGNHPAVLNFFLKIGQSMQEGGFLKGSVNTPKGTSTAASAMFGENHPSAN